MRKIYLLLVAGVSAAPVLADNGTVFGPEQYLVLDGGTIIASGKHLKLQHIAVPSLNTSCRIGTKMRDCGRISRSQLMDLTVASTVACRSAGNGKSFCTAGGFDLSEQMVYTGWAVPTSGAPAKYWTQMAGARARKRGFWKAEFVPAWPPQRKALNEKP